MGMDIEDVPPWEKPIEWAWGDEKKDRYIDGFKSRDEAIKHAKLTSTKEIWAEPKKIVVGHVFRPESGFYAHPCKLTFEKIDEIVVFYGVAIEVQR